VTRDLAFAEEPMELQFRGVRERPDLPEREHAAVVQRNGEFFPDRSLPPILR
jgi:hypothetical protein